MKFTTVWKTLVFVLPIVYASSAWSITPDEEKFICKKPKFREFTPAHKAEVLPGSEVSFHVSQGASTEHVKLEIKGEKVPIKVVDKKAYLLVTSQLPASIIDGYARIHVSAKASEGDCFGSDGWLIKIKETNAPASVEASK